MLSKIFGLLLSIISLLFQLFGFGLAGLLTLLGVCMGLVGFVLVCSPFLLVLLVLL